MKKIIIYVFLFLFVLIVFSIINLLNTYFSERVEYYIENKGTVYTQEFISQAIMENVIEEIQISTLYLINEDNNKQVKSVIINTSQINKILSLVNKTLNDKITKMSEEKLIIPFSSIFGETLFSKLGPNLSLRIIPIGKFQCDVVSEVSSYGINNRRHPGHGLRRRSDAQPVRILDAATSADPLRRSPRRRRGPILASNAE